MNEVFEFLGVNAIAAGIIGILVTVIGVLLNKTLKNMESKFETLQQSVVSTLGKVEDIEDEYAKNQVAIATNLATMNGQITMALARTGDIDIIKKDIWKLEARMDSAYRIIDPAPRKSDL